MKPLRTKRPGSLRARLARGMILVLVCALLASALIDRAHLVMPAGIARILTIEPLQDSLVLASFAVVAMALIWLISGWSLRPIARVSRQAANVGPANPAERLATTGLPSEILPLIAATNSALDRMQAALEAQRRFTADAAHELRTPLTVLSLRLQQARASAPDWPAIDTDIQNMARLVHQLLDLARKEANHSLAPLNLARVAREAASQILPLAEAQGRALLVDLPPNLPLQGRADDLRDAITNLLENALIHGQGTIRLHATTTPTEIHIDVSDEGPGIPQAQRQTVFARFTKLNQTTQGSGLGLAIVQQVATAHGGHAQILPTPPLHPPPNPTPPSTVGRKSAAMSAPLKATILIQPYAIASASAEPQIYAEASL